jgi:hypothetical protein
VNATGKRTCLGGCRAIGTRISPLGRHYSPNPPAEVRKGNRTTVKPFAQMSTCSDSRLGRAPGPAGSPAHRDQKTMQDDSPTTSETMTLHTALGGY